MQGDIIYAQFDSMDIPNHQWAWWKETAVVMLAMVYSGNPAPERIVAVEPQLICLAGFLGWALIRRERPAVSRDLMAMAMVFGAILLVQCVSFKFFPLVTLAGFAVRLYIGYAVVTLVDDFPRVYVRAIYCMALISLAVYVPYVMLHMVGIHVETYLSGLARALGTISLTRRPLLLHTFYGHYSSRNFGMFWEPGAFQGYLILGMVFLALLKDRLDKRQYRKYLWTLCIAVLTTMSTTGYIAMVLVIFMQYDWNAADPRTTSNRILFGVYVILPIIALGSTLAYAKLPFLGDKIEAQLHALERRQGRWHRGRFGSLIFDWEYVKRRPLTGWGLHSRTRYALHPQMADSEGMGNGFSDFIAKFGVVGFLMWMLMVLRSFHQLVPRSALQIAFIGMVLLLLLQGERFLAYPLFLGLAFMATPERSVLADAYHEWPREVILGHEG